MSFPKSSILVVDASAFIFRAYFALAPLSSKGRPSHAVAGFAGMLLKLIREKNPKSCVVVFDSKAPSFRKEIYSEYKANRDAPPPDISDQIKATIVMCEKAGLPTLQGETFEADDWIASFAKTYKTKSPVVVVSSDKDLAQLVDSKVFMYDSFKNKLLDSKAVAEKWGVQPSQMGDYLALIGDASDNIPGLPGVGPKTAAKWLEEFKTIAGIYKNIDSLPKKQQEKLKDNKEQLDLSRQLVELKADLKLPFEKTSELQTPFPKDLLDFLVDWDCKRVIEQFADELGLGASGVDSSATTLKQEETSLGLIKTKNDLEALKKEIQQAELVAYDIESNSFNRDEAQLVGISFCTKPSSAHYLPVRHGKVDLSEKEMLSFVDWFCQLKNVKKLAHNSKYDLQILRKEGFELVDAVEDSMIQGHLLHAERRSFSLANLAKDFLGEDKGDLEKTLDGSQNFADVPLEEAVAYAAKDAALSFKLSQEFRPKISAEKKINWLYEKVEMPLVEVIASMEDTGIRLDRDHLAKLSEEMHQQIESVQEKIYSAAGDEFNIGSPKQLQKILFENLGLTPIKKTKTGYSTDESVLTELASEHKVPALILEYRRLSKLTSTYVDVLPILVSEHDGRLRTSYHQTGTATGRLSSSDPNLQNIPIRTPEGMKIREAFIAEKGFQLFSADYSQVELRLMAHLSGDKKMIEAFQNSRDIHSETAKAIFGTDDKEHRSRAKAINFGIIYGISAFGLSNQLGISRGEAKGFIDSYFEQFPGVLEYMEQMKELAKEQGYSETLFGRRRPLPDIKSKNAMLRQNAERISINAPLQGTAADVMKWAMVNVATLLKSSNLKSRLLLQVHDELVLEVAEGEEDQLKELVIQGMQDFEKSPAKEIQVPLEVDTSFGSNWAQL